jgi:hypothetical protein
MTPGLTTLRRAAIALLAIQTAHWACAISYCFARGVVYPDMPGLSVAMVASLAIGTCVSVSGGDGVDGPCDAAGRLVTALLFLVPFFAAPVMMSQVVWWIAVQFLATIHASGGAA